MELALGAAWALVEALAVAQVLAQQGEVEWDKAWVGDEVWALHRPWVEDAAEVALEQQASDTGLVQVAPSALDVVSVEEAPEASSPLVLLVAVLVEASPLVASWVLVPQ